MLIYSNLKTKNTIFELWGASTKHPDVRRVLQWDIEEGRFTPSQLITTPEYQCFQWLVQCCAELSFGTLDHLREVMQWTTCFDDMKCWA